MNLTVIAFLHEKFAPGKVMIFVMKEHYFYRILYGEDEWQPVHQVKKPYGGLLPAKRVF